MITEQLLLFEELICWSHGIRNIQYSQKKQYTKQHWKRDEIYVL